MSAMKLSQQINHLALEVEQAKVLQKKNHNRVGLSTCLCGCQKQLRMQYCLDCLTVIKWAR